MSARHVMEAIEKSTDRHTDTIICGGGGFRSNPWGQIRADVLGKSLQRMKVNEPGVVGAACVALASSDSVGSLTAAHAPFAKFEGIWEPEPGKKAFYDDLFGLYLEALATNETLGRRITQLQ